MKKDYSDFCFDEYEYINFLVEKSDYIYALVLADAYIDLKLAQCFVVYLDNLDYNNKNKKNIINFKKMDYIKRKRKINKFVKEILEKDTILDDPWFKKYKLDKILKDIKKFKIRRNDIVHDVSGLNKIGKTEYSNRSRWIFEKRYVHDKNNMIKLKPLIKRSLKIIDRLERLYRIILDKETDF